MLDASHVLAGQQKSATNQTFSASDGSASPLIAIPKAAWQLSRIVVQIAVGVAFTVQLVLMFSDVVLRMASGYYVPWTLDLSRLNMAVIAFGGAVLAYERNEHVGLTALRSRLPLSVQPSLAVALEVLTFAMATLLTVYSIPLARQDWTHRSASLQWRETWFVLPFTVGLGLIAVFSLARIVMSGWRPLCVGVGALAIFFILADIARYYIDPYGAGGMSVLIVQIGFFAILLVVGLPVGFSLVVASIAYLYFAGDYGTPTTVVINMTQGIGDFVLLAIPFFVMVGLLMAESGLSRRLMNCLGIVVGRLPGGLLQVVVAASFIFSGLSGAKIADVVAVGTPMKKPLMDADYDMSESAAVLAASAAAGETVPPSIAMIVLGSVTSVSISALFIAGILPALCITISIGVLVHLRTRKSDRPKVAWPGWVAAGRATAVAAPAFVIPLIIIWAVETGSATPTEVSAVAAVLCLIFTALYREVSWAGLWSLLCRGAAMSGVILVLISAASAFSWSLTAANLADRIAHWFDDFSAGALPFVLLSFLIMLVMGALLEGLPAIIVFAPLLFPTAEHLGVNLLQYGVVMIIAMGIGAFSPPMGLGLYVASSVTGVSFESAARKMLPYVFLLIGVAIVIILIPGLSLWLPRLLHLAS